MHRITAQFFSGYSMCQRQSKERRMDDYSTGLDPVIFRKGEIGGKRCSDLSKLQLVWLQGTGMLSRSLVCRALLSNEENTTEMVLEF